MSLLVAGTWLRIPSTLEEGSKDADSMELTRQANAGYFLAGLRRGVSPLLRRLRAWEVLPLLGRGSSTGTWTAAIAALYLRSNRDLRRAALLGCRTPLRTAVSRVLIAARTSCRAASRSPLAMRATACVRGVLGVL